MVGSQLHLALTLDSCTHPTSHQQQKDSPPGLSHLLEARILAFVSLGGVSVCLSTLVSDQPLDPSTQVAGNPGPATFLKVTLKLPSLPKGHPRPHWEPKPLANMATSYPLMSIFPSLTLLSSYSFLTTY